MKAISKQSSKSGDKSAKRNSMKAASNEISKSSNKRKRPSISPKPSNSSLISPPAKVIKADKWVGPGGGSWKGWALVEIDDNEPKNLKQETPPNTLRTSRGRTIKAGKDGHWLKLMIMNQKI